MLGRGAPLGFCPLGRGDTAPGGVDERAKPSGRVGVELERPGGGDVAPLGFGIRELTGCVRG